MWTTTFKSKMREPTFQMKLLAVAVASGASAFTVYQYMFVKKDSPPRKKASPAVIDAEYAGYREKTSDYPNRQGANKSQTPK